MMQAAFFSISREETGEAHGLWMKSGRTNSMLVVLPYSFTALEAKKNGMFMI